MLIGRFERTHQLIDLASRSNSIGTFFYYITFGEYILMPHDLEQQRQAGMKSKRHGIYSFRDKGEEVLEKNNRSRYIELRDQFKSSPGRVEYRQHLAAHIAMMVELGFDELRRVAENGGSIWEAPPTKRMGTYLNSLIRLLDGFPKTSGDRHTFELNKIRKVLEDSKDDKTSSS